MNPLGPTRPADAEVLFDTSTGNRWISAIAIAAPLVAAPFLPWSEVRLSDLVLVPVVLIWTIMFVRNARVAVWSEGAGAECRVLVVRNSFRSYRVATTDIHQVTTSGGGRFPYTVTLGRRTGRSIRLDASGMSGLLSRRRLDPKVALLQRWLDQQ